MIASDIINLILQRYKMLCTKYPQSPSFIPNNKGDSFYLIRKMSGNLQPTQIRLSNHGTYLETWVDREELGESVERLNPAFCINISIVFVDEGEDLTNDCKGMSNCEGCEIEPCIPQTFEGQDELGRPFKVLQYIYNSRCIRNKYINGITKAIMEASIKGEYKDPLANLYRAAKEKELHSSTKEQNKELNTEQYMNKKLIRLTESDLHRIVKKSVSKILKESYADDRYNMGTFCNSGDKQYDSLSDKLFAYIEDWGISRQMEGNKTFQEGRNMLHQALKTLERGFREYNNYDGGGIGDSGEGFSDYSGGAYY